MNSATNTFNLTAANKLVTDAGFTTMGGFEDGLLILAASAEAHAGCFGHPAFTVHFNKATGWLTVTGQRPVKLGVGA